MACFDCPIHGMSGFVKCCVEIRDAIRSGAEAQPAVYRGEDGYSIVFCTKCMSRLRRFPPGDRVDLLFDQEALPPALRIEMRGACWVCSSEWLLRTGNEELIEKTRWNSG